MTATQPTLPARPDLLRPGLWLVHDQGWRRVPYVLLCGPDHLGRWEAVDHSALEVVGIDTDALSRLHIDLTEPASIGVLLRVWHERLTLLTSPCPVASLLSHYGPTHPRTVAALIAALEAGR